MILLQETWLYSFEDSAFDIFTNEYNFVHASSMSSHRIRKGRPYGGVAFLFKKSISDKVKRVTSISDTRMIAITLETTSGTLLIVNVYLPVNSPSNEELICKYILSRTLELYLNWKS